MFFTPTDDFTHHASFWGIPCYIAEDSDDCTIAGTNIVYDWIILHIVPWCFWLNNLILSAADPDFEPGGWPILVKGEIKK